MNNVSRLLNAIVRPTGDTSTDARSYKAFYGERARTENYGRERIEVIGRLGEVVVSVSYSISINQPLSFISSTKTRDENADVLPFINADPILLPFCDSKGIRSAFLIYAELIPSVFKNIKGLRAEFVVDPEIENEQRIAFYLTIEAEPQEVLRQENEFYKRLTGLIRSHDRKYFSLVYSVL